MQVLKEKKNLLIAHQQAINTEDVDLVIFTLELLKDFYQESQQMDKYYKSTENLLKYYKNKSL